MSAVRLRTQYLVISQDGQWHVSRHGKLYGPYPSQAAAVRGAIEVAQASSLNHRHSEVLSKQADETMRVEWTYGLDP